MTSIGKAATHKKLTSVSQLRDEIVECRQLVNELTVRKQGCVQALADTRAQLEALQARMLEFEREAHTIGQELYVRLAELDRLLALQARVHERAQRYAEQHQGALEGELAQLVRLEQQTAHNNRTSKRVSVAVEIGLESETNFFTGFSENLSAGGLYVSTETPLPEKSRFVAQFTLPTDPRPIACMVEVAWVRHAGKAHDPRVDTSPGMGCRFIGLSDEDAARIARFIELREPLFYPDWDEPL